MSRFVFPSLATCVGLLVAMSCNGNVILGDASGTSAGAGAGGGGAGAGPGTGAGAGAGAGGVSGNTTTTTNGTSSGNGTSSSTSSGLAGSSSVSTGSATSTASTGTASSVASSSGTGSGGAPPLVSPCGAGPGSLGWLDTMDNGSRRIDPTDGRKGSWYTFNDASPGGVQSPAASSLFAMTAIPADAPIAGHVLAANTFGSGFNVYGAGMAFDLNNDGITYGAYDASQFKGICLWVRVGPRADSGGGIIRMRILDANSTPQGGVCNGSATSGADQCYDGFGADLTLTQEWQVFQFPWASLTQQGWGLPEKAIDAKALYSVDFDTGASDAFDTWVWGFEFL